MQATAASPTVPAGVTPAPPRMAVLRVELEGEAPATDYMVSLASLVHGGGGAIVLVDARGRRREDLLLEEIVARLRSQADATLQVVIGEAPSAIRLDIVRAATSVTLRLRLASGGVIVTHWLQADASHLGPIPVLALPAGEDGLVEDAVHGLVALAARAGGLRQAHLQFDGEPSPRRTWTAQSAAEATPIVSAHAEVAWVACRPTDTAPAAWSLPPVAVPASAPPPLSPEWWSRFDDLARAATTASAELEAHVRPLLPAHIHWRLEPLMPALTVATMTAPAAERAVVLLPRADEIVVAVDLHQPPEVLQALVLHALAHLAIGHVRPGDRWAHADAPADIAEPRGQWDRDARDHVTAHWARQTVRASLDDCTAAEKAQLGLWRMIGEMLGESRRLHPSAERYQRAAYQRQAAQRLVAMLDEYGGAMLCDGVGLGKTYVATTVIVHDVNLWLAEHAGEGPYRVTVLAPNSVVSTWRREALPPLASRHVAPGMVRVMSHTRLSRMTRASELVAPAADGGPSDLEHLLLSDLVIVDEAHNFRALTARRTKVLRDLLRLQPRRERRRRVLLLTATPINNSLDDLRQEVSLLFSRPLLLSDARTDKGYRDQAAAEVARRCERARKSRGKGDIAALVIHGDADARFSDAIDFRDDLDFGPSVRRIGDYLKEQDQRLKDLQAAIRAAAQDGAPRPPQEGPVRIAEELLDRIVVQRSRDLCKDIERQQSSGVELLFRPDAGPPEPLRYDDEYDGIEDALRRFLPLFDGEPSDRAGAARPLSLKVYMWYDVREGLKEADETSSVVGLQRILVLKRLESSPVAFLITLLRLTVLHAHRLHQLVELCDEVDRNRRRLLEADLERILRAQPSAALEKLRCLATGDTAKNPRSDLLRSLSRAHEADRPAADTDDLRVQPTLFDEEPAADRRQQLDRLWGLREALVADFETLLTVTPDLADIVFGRFARSEWPRRFTAGGDDIDWPRSPVWGRRLVTDAKLRQLVARLLRARQAGQKVIVFSQFSDTIAYIRSVLAATEGFELSDWRQVLPGLGIPGLRREDLTGLREVTVAVTGDTEDRDDVVNAFAPFYRIGPWRPVAPEGGDPAAAAEHARLDEGWKAAWTRALTRRVDVLLSSDVLAEGVNLQDAALLINFDVHWNPVRMIQRAGRVDRRLNPRIEQAGRFPDVEQLAAGLGQEAPRYYWHDHAGEAPVTVNMILSDELEAELQLRERLATKTLAIDFTLGLEQGTGAEADWMASYRYQGIKSLDSFQRDRAIEQVARHHERLARRFAELGIHPAWAEKLNGWFRQAGVDQAAPLVARAMIGLQGGELERFGRYLEPAVVDGVAHWFWCEQTPGQSMFDGWLVLDGKTWPPPPPRRDIAWHERVASAVKATHLLTAVDQLERGLAVEDWSRSFKGVGRFLQQGCTAIAAPKFARDRPHVRVPSVFILQLASFEAEPSGDGSPGSAATGAA